MVATAAASINTPRPRGRPRSLSQAAVLDVALSLLEDAPLEDFTLGRLAKRLGVPITSLYTYYPNRDALLAAAGERMFARFDWTPQSDADWQSVLLSWMLALSRHFEHYPITQKVLAWDERISPAWLRVLEPIITLLHDQGLRGEELARTFAWFIQGTIGFIDAHAYTARNQPQSSIAPLDMRRVASGEMAALFEFWRYAGELDQQRVLESGLRGLVDGVARCMVEMHAHGAAVAEQRTAEQRTAD